MPDRTRLLCGLLTVRPRPLGLPSASNVTFFLVDTSREPRQIERYLPGFGGVAGPVDGVAGLLPGAVEGCGGFAAGFGVCVGPPGLGGIGARLIRTSSQKTS